MSTTHSQLRASIDLGVSIDSLVLNDKKTKMVRNHPPRLQHSPSLPNIWFPPHSGPIPPQFGGITRESLRRPTSPPPLLSDNTTYTDPVPRKKTPERHGISSFDDLSSHTPQAKPLESQKRRRVDRDYGHSLLTPPLTPSSSLRTAASIDSTNNPDSYHDIDKEISSSDEEERHATHFLLLSNICKKTPSDILRSAIVSSLTAPRPSTPSGIPNTLSVPNSSSKLSPLSEDSIKGVFVLCQESHGIVMLAFFDIRHAIIAKKILSTPSSDILSDCIGDELTEDGEKTWISCQFVTADDLAETIGNSIFLASVDSSFYLSVEGRKAEGAELRIEDNQGINENESTTGSEVNEGGGGRHGINLTMLKSMLKSFGGLKSFSLAESGLNITELPSEVFHLEYYDVREANAAYVALDGQILFGMKLKVFGRNVQIDQTHSAAETQQRGIQPDDSQKNVVSSLAVTAHSDETPLRIQPAGHYSQTRQPFIYAEPSQPRPRSATAGHHEYSASFPSPPTFLPSPHHGAPSPIYFYNSSPTGNATAGASDLQSQQLPIQLRDAIGRPYIPTGTLDARDATDIVPNSGFELVDDAPHTDTILRGDEVVLHSDPGLQFYGRHHDCYYCPSNGAAGNPNCYHTSYSTQSPSFYPHVHRSQPLTNMHFSVSSPPSSMHGPGYEYDTSYIQPIGSPTNLNMTNWDFKHMITTHLPAPEFWYPENSGMNPSIAQGVPYHPPQMPLPTGYIAPYYPLPAKQENQLQLEPLTSTPSNIYRRNTPSSKHSPLSSRVSHGSQGLLSRKTREPPPTPESNQLNIARIESGQDTRTTVMIKNIPNKMSDKDLIAYIGKVCPRRIDFLYLRIDFRNGCNVGYAFVNFIDVKDLLLFAQKKLGERWNMFSSEKVLQMSYANYQSKEALVEKLKNSCIMDEREAWRPKIFYSEPGPNQGLPEPFPAPTHLGRKERSSFNRGALYVPGVGRGPSAPQMNTPVPTRRQQQNERRSSQGRHADPESLDTLNVDGHSYSPLRRRPSQKLWSTL